MVVLLVYYGYSFLSIKDQNTHGWNYKKILAILCSFFPCCAGDPNCNDWDIQVTSQSSVIHKMSS